MTRGDKELLGAFACGLLFWVVVLGAVAMAIQRACAS